LRQWHDTGFPITIVTIGTEYMTPNRGDVVMSDEIRISKQTLILVAAIVLACFAGVVILAVNGTFTRAVSTPVQTAEPKALPETEKPAEPDATPEVRSKPLVIQYARLPPVHESEIELTFAEQFGKRFVSLKSGRGFSLLDSKSRPTTGTIVNVQTDGIIRVTQFVDGVRNGVEIAHHRDYTRTDQIRHGKIISRQYVRADGRITTTEYQNGKAVSTQEAWPVFTPGE
jgi:hypothetical protein